jgi:hypothetical protein
MVQYVFARFRNVAEAFEPISVGQDKSNRGGNPSGGLTRRFAYKLLSRSQEVCSRFSLYDLELCFSAEGSSSCLRSRLSAYWVAIPSRTSTDVFCYPVLCLDLERVTKRFWKVLPSIKFSQWRYILERLIAKQSYIWINITCLWLALLRYLIKMVPILLGICIILGRSWV